MKKINDKCDKCNGSGTDVNGDTCDHCGGAGQY
mgnify:CR=1 FL=1